MCATNYTSLGYLEHEKIEELFMNHPEYKAEMEKNVMQHY